MTVLVFYLFININTKRQNVSFLNVPGRQFYQNGQNVHFYLPFYKTRKNVSKPRRLLTNSRTPFDGFTCFWQFYVFLAILTILRVFGTFMAKWIRAIMAVLTHFSQNSQKVLKTVILPDTVFDTLVLTLIWMGIRVKMCQNVSNPVKRFYKKVYKTPLIINGFHSPTTVFTVFAVFYRPPLIINGNLAIL